MKKGSNKTVEPQGDDKNKMGSTGNKSASKLRDQREKYNQFHDPGIQVGAGEFPAQYHSRPASDRAVGLKQDYVRHLNEYSPDLGAKYDVTDSEVDALVRRYSELDLINFERYISAWFDTGDPTHQRLINELYPQYFERRLDQIEANLEVQRRVAHLKLLGPRDADDLRFAYLLETGVVELPTAPVFDVSDHDNTKSRGLFNPYVLFGSANAKAPTGSWRAATGASKSFSTGAGGYSAPTSSVFSTASPNAKPGNLQGFGSGKAWNEASPMFAVPPKL